MENLFSWIEQTLNWMIAIATSIKEIFFAMKDTLIIGILFVK